MSESIRGLVPNLNEIRSIRNTAEIKRRVKNVLLKYHPDAPLQDMSIISYTDLKDDGRHYLISSISIDLVKERVPRNKKAIHMLKHSYVVMVNVVVEGLPEKVPEYVKFTFTKDAILYNLAFPRYAELQKIVSVKRKLLDVFPLYYSEETITDVKEIDKVSLFILEDLKTDGYVTLEPIKEFDLKHTLLIVEKLAYFHAVGIALLRRNPKVFETDLNEINNHLESYQNKFYSDRAKEISKVLLANVKLNKYSEKFESIVKRPPSGVSNNIYSTLIHNNFWKNNIQLKYRLRKQYPTDPRFVKFINFQFCIQGSPILDLVQFVFTSTIWIVKNDFLSISYHYFYSLIKYLKHSRCIKPIVAEFTIENFQDELRNSAWMKLRSILSSVIENSKGLDNEELVESIQNVFYWFEKYKLL